MSDQQATWSLTLVPGLGPGSGSGIIQNSGHGLRIPSLHDSPSPPSPHSKAWLHLSWYFAGAAVSPLTMAAAGGSKGEASMHWSFAWDKAAILGDS